MNPKDLFDTFDGKEDNGFPVIDATVYQSSCGTLYLKEPGVVVVSKPSVYLGGITDFLAGFNAPTHFDQYLEDPTTLTGGAQLCKFAGQLCYLSFDTKRTKNAEAQRYFDNLKSSGHGSVLEHANYTLLLYGVSRSLTHELVRHRAGFGFSQLSQRYVSGKALRFVERPEYQDDVHLHAQFLERIDHVATEYKALTERLLKMQKDGSAVLSGEVRTDLRKKVQQTARSVLPNETEAPIVVTGNARAWRHFIEMRASAHAEIEIRALAVRVLLCLSMTNPVLFDDYEIEECGDGTYIAHTPYEKV